MFHSLGLAGWAYKGALGQFLRGRIWLPFTLVALVQLLSLLVLLGFTRPVLAPWVTPLITWVGGEEATHYPLFFAALPQVFDRWNLVVAVFFASFMGGVGTVLFAGAFSGNVGNAWRAARERYGALVLVASAGAVLSLSLFFLTSLVPSDLVLGNGKVRWGLRGASLVFFILTQTLIVYASASVLLGGKSGLAALGQSVRLAGRFFLATVVVVAIPVLCNYPLSYLTERVDWFLFKFSPELMAGLLATRIVWEMVLSFLLVGAVTRLYLSMHRSVS